MALASVKVALFERHGGSALPCKRLLVGGICTLFEAEPDDEHYWSEQDIFEQARKIILKWNAIDDPG